MQEKTYKKHLTIWIIVTVVVAGIAFYGGTVHGKNSAAAAQAAARGQFAGAGGRTGGNRFGTGGGAVSGAVTSKDATSITVQSRDGSSKIILISGTTPILKTSTGSATDVAIGTQVSVQGTQNSDGSVTAQTVQIRPNLPAGPAVGNQPPAAQ